MIDKKTRDEWRKLFRQAHSCSNCKEVCKPFQLLDTCDQLETELSQARSCAEKLGTEKDEAVDAGDALYKLFQKEFAGAEEIEPALAEWKRIIDREKGE